MIGRRLLRHAPLAALVIACSGGGGGDAATSAAPTPAPPASYELGRRADAVAIAAVDIDVDTTGAGLPAGRGTHATGAPVYIAKCASCHGLAGEGMTTTPPMPRIVGRDPRDGFGFGGDPKLVKTVGNYWPHSTTLYDYVRRAMPITAPGSLTPDEVYGVVAWILAENEIIPRDAEMTAQTLPAVRMPAHGKFVVDNRTGGKIFR